MSELKLSEWAEENIVPEGARARAGAAIRGWIVPIRERVSWPLAAIQAGSLKLRTALFGLRRAFVGVFSDVYVLGTGLFVPGT